jgi:hypothetical protein
MDNKRLKARRVGLTFFPDFASALARCLRYRLAARRKRFATTRRIPSSIPSNVTDRPGLLTDPITALSSVCRNGVRSTT